MYYFRAPPTVLYHVGKLFRVLSWYGPEFHTSPIYMQDIVRYMQGIIIDKLMEVFFI